MLKFVNFLVILYFLLLRNLLSGDIREFEIGVNVDDLSTKGYLNIKCSNSEKALDSWNNYKDCTKDIDKLHTISFEYDDKYAFNENFEGTQVAGHPVLLKIGINSLGNISKIYVHTDPSAPFYFKKQAYLFWLRIKSKFGSKGWKCNDLIMKKNHIIINQKYINKMCEKEYKSKKIFYHTEFYFLESKEKENLISRTKLIISSLNL